MQNLDDNNKMASVQYKGHYNDPDMLQVGNSGLNPIEQLAHFSLWCLITGPLRSPFNSNPNLDWITGPLLISTDLGSLSDAALQILKAPELIAISQDSLYQQGVRVSAAAPQGMEVWAKPLSGDLGVAVILLNRSEKAADIAVDFRTVGVTSPRAAVRDLWLRKDLGEFEESFTGRGVPSHGTLTVRISPATMGAV